MLKGELSPHAMRGGGVWTEDTPSGFSQIAIFGAPVHISAHAVKISDTVSHLGHLTLFRAGSEALRIGRGPCRYVLLSWTSTCGVEITVQINPLPSHLENHK